MTIPSGSTVTWSGTADAGVTWYQIGNDVFCNFTGLDQIADLDINISNACGSYSERYRFRCTTMSSCGITPLRVGLSPNPANENIQVSLEEKSDKTKKKDILEVRILDKMGSLKRTIKYGVNQKNISLQKCNYDFKN